MDELERRVAIGDPLAMLDKIESAVRSLEERSARLQNEIDQLTARGVCDAKPYYRDGKYLYLIYPMVDGERKREYIGGDPEKIEEALAKIERKGTIEELENKLSAVKGVLSQTKFYLSQAIVSAYSVQW